MNDELGVGGHGEWPMVDAVGRRADGGTWQARSGRIVDRRAHLCIAGDGETIILTFRIGGIRRST